MAKKNKAIKFNWNKSSSLIISELGFGKELNKDFANIFLQYCEQYIPYDTGRLDANVQVRATNDHGTIVFNTPYAYAQYYGANKSNPEGTNYVEGEKNQPSYWNRNLQFHPLATSFWDKAAWYDGSAQITKEVNKARRKYMKNR